MFSARDAVLLRAVDKHGALNRATEVLECSFSHAQRHISGVAEATRTVLIGPVTTRDGELVTVETGAGAVTALAPADTTVVEVAVRVDTVMQTAPDDAPEPTGTSVGNAFNGEIITIESGEAVARVVIDIGVAVEFTALLIQTSVETLTLAPGTEVVASFKTTATRGVPKRTTD